MAINAYDPFLPGGKFKYGEALQKSFLFYEAQRAGDLPEDNRIDWRGDSTLQDGSDVGLDLSGGYFDAGDTVKFGLPMAAAMTTLAWGAEQYREGYERSGQLDEAMDALKWGTDYILNAHVVEDGKTKTFYGQVGLGDIDHNYKGRVEDAMVYRPSSRIDRSNPGTDLAAETAAALASASMVFRPTDEDYANELLNNAKQLYEFADTYRDEYSNSIADTQKFYSSDGSYREELAWGATWLYKASGEEQYLDKAIANYTRVDWTQSWGDRSFGTAVLLAEELPQDPRYSEHAERWLDNWAEGGEGIEYTPGGFAWIAEWGSASLASNAAFIAGVYSDTVEDPDGKYSDFSERQIDYLLGENPNQFSYMVGFGDRYAKQVHHRNALGDLDVNSTADNPHILYGGLVGGLKRPDDYAYQDNREDYIGNEVALDANGGITGALARMYGKYGGDPLTNEQLNALPGISVEFPAAPTEAL